MPKIYNTPKRTHIVKTRLDDEEYADFLRRMEIYDMSQSEYIREAISGAAICPVVVASPINDIKITPALTGIYESGDTSFSNNAMSSYTVKYGTSADSCNLNSIGEITISAPGTYTYYFQITKDGNYEAQTGELVYTYTDPNASASTPESSSNQNTSGGGSTETAEEDSASQTPAPEVPKNVINVEGEAPVTSTVGGVYSTAKVAGTAVTTPADQIHDAVGDVATGNNVAMYVCDAVRKEFKEHLASFISNTSNKILNYLTADMYIISPAGGVVNIRETDKAVTVVIQLNAADADANRSYSVFFTLPDGRVVEYKDTDNNPNTITIMTKTFSVCAITYTAK